jgi:hypothetical protein
MLKAFCYHYYDDIVQTEADEYLIIVFIQANSTVYITYSQYTVNLNPRETNCDFAK